MERKNSLFGSSSSQTERKDLFKPGKVSRHASEGIKRKKKLGEFRASVRESRGVEANSDRGRREKKKEKIERETRPDLRSLKRFGRGIKKKERHPRFER